MKYENILTTCVYCGCGCGVYLELLDGQIAGVLPVREHPVSRGSLCIKGWNVASFVNHPDRLTTPLVRKGDGFEEASWDEALAVVAKGLAAARDEHGPDSVGYLASAKCTNEENYLFQKLARAVGRTNNVDHCARL